MYYLSDLTTQNNYRNVFSKIVLPSPNIDIHHTRKSATIVMYAYRGPTLYKLSPSIMACRSHSIFIRNFMQWRRRWSYNHLRLKIMKSDILNFIKTLCILFIWLEIRKNNVFTRSYLRSRGFFGSNISSDYSVAWRRILNYGRRLLWFTKPTLVTITRCWCRWSRLCNALNIYLSCSCWC